MLNLLLALGRDPMAAMANSTGSGLSVILAMMVSVYVPSLTCHDATSSWDSRFSAGEALRTFPFQSEAWAGKQETFSSLVSPTSSSSSEGSTKKGYSSAEGGCRRMPRVGGGGLPGEACGSRSEE